MPPLISLLKLPFAVAAFLLPGWLLSRRIRNPAPAITAFLGSCAVLFSLVLLLTVLHVPLHAGTVGAGLVIISAAASWRAPARQPELEKPSQPSGRRPWLWWLIAAVALASITAQALVEPLSGYDTRFRWDYLAKLMIAGESLAPYPPVSASDFQLYGWCDGIPPLVAILHFWIYTVTGSTAAVLTAVRVAGEAVVLGGAVSALGREVWGRTAGAVAVAVLATSSLLLWSIAIGQETGLTALSLVSLLYLLLVHQRTPRVETAFWAAVAASVGGMTREYGLAFAVLGLAALVWQKAPGKSLLAYLIACTALSAPWYLRNWVITGNPLYPQSLGGLFPTNPVHVELMRSIAGEWSFFTTPYHPSYVVKYLAMTTGFAVLVGIIGIFRARRQAALAAAALALVVALWLWSVPQTGGGWVYSGRVLAPLIAVAAAFSGWIATMRRSVRLGLAVVVAALGLDAARRSWFLPVAPLAWSSAHWLEVKHGIDALNDQRVWTMLAQAAEGRGIVVEQPLHHSMVIAGGGRPVPLTSPVLAPAFSATLPFRDVVDRLKQANIRFIAVNPTAPSLQDFAAAHPFWAELCQHHRPAITVPVVAVYDLYDLRRLPPD